MLPSVTGTGEVLDPLGLAIEGVLRLGVDQVEARQGIGVADYAHGGYHPVWWVRIGGRNGTARLRFAWPTVMIFRTWTIMTPTVEGVHREAVRLSGSDARDSRPG
jgi:hypothetical protein